jgi:glutamate--cysteine ligase
MKTRTAAPEELHDLESAIEAIDRLTWENSLRQEQIGLEIEAFPMADGPRFGSRLPLHGAGGAVDIVGRGLRSLSAPSAQHPPIFSTGDGGRVSFEPGGQVELSTSAHTTTSSLMGEIDRSWNTLESVFRERRVGLVSLGLDPWHDSRDVPQQQRTGRYIAMDTYFSKRWPAGAAMMRNTCSLQVNVESGTQGTRQERWLAANMISPILTAMFSTSPGPRGVANRRAGIWQAIDPTRTGYPYWRRLDRIDPLDDARVRALGANVMFVAREGRVTALAPGFTLDEWVRSGHPDIGRPTIDDLRTHLTTVFTETRPRGGILEIRAVDAQLPRWWVVPAVIIAGILYDDHARSQAVELTLPYAGQLERTWRWSAHAGLKDRGLGDIAFKLAKVALDAARRSPRFDHRAITATEEFIDRFTLRGLSPADEIRPLLNGSVSADQVRVTSAREVGP